ncbi:MAG: S49 family peptidase, partial [Gammaproteobacteria bacterium]|nr:S49 family peptidase [Gammaproteobacteria bacterium]
MNDDGTSKPSDTGIPPKPVQSDGQGDAQWERDLLNRLAFAALNEQRRTRRWGIFFKTLVFIYVFALMFAYRPEGWQNVGAKVGKHTALVEVSGIIAAEGDASADTVITGLRAAFEDKKTAGVIVR